MTPKEKANDLVNQYRNILMDEDTECGNEILCTLIAVKCSLVTIMHTADHDSDNIDYWNNVIKKLKKI